MKRNRRAATFSPSGDLDQLKRAGIPTDTLVRLLGAIAKTGPQRMTPATKRKLLDNRDTARSLSRSIEKLRRKAIKFVEADPFLGVQTPVYVLDDEPKLPPHREELHKKLMLKASRVPRINPATPVGMAFDGMKALADLMNQASFAFGAMSRRNAHADRGIDFILLWIRICNEDFDGWKALARLLIAAGIVPKDTTVFTAADRLRKAAERRAAPLWPVKGHA